MNSNIKDRFLDKVNKTDTCWFWSGATRSGYGALKIDGEVKGAHRVSYRLYKGPIPSGLLVCHSCDNKNCVNPEHLWAGTYKDNMEDASRKGRVKTNPELISETLTEYEVCTVGGCNNDHRAKGLCRHHYYNKFKQ